MSGSAPPLGWVPPRRLRAVWLLSLLIHAAIIFLWLQQPQPTRTRPVSRMEVRIVPEVPSRRNSTPKTVALPPPGSVLNAGARERRDPRQRSTQPAAITAPAQPAAPGPAPSATPSSAVAATIDPQPITAPLPSTHPPPSAPSPGQGGLRLDWTPPPRSARAASAPTVREQALNDARANTQRPTAEARMAQNFGSDGLQEEALGDGRRRVRKGAACVDVHRTTIAQINPYDDRLRDIQVAKACD